MTKRDNVKDGAGSKVELGMSQACSRFDYGANTFMQESQPQASGIITLELYTAKIYLNRECKKKN